MSNEERELCGEPTTKGHPCRNKKSSCPWDHDNGGNPNGRTKLLDDGRKQELVLTAVRAGLTFSDQAAHAKVSEDTLRRRLCCVETPREPTLTTDEPCDFCESYAHAHAGGAISVLEECKPEFRAAASFGYTDKQTVEHTGEGGGPIEINFSEEVVETPWQEDNE